MKYAYKYARPIDHPEDVDRIVKVFANRGHELSREAALDAWTGASSDRFASWLILDDDDETLFELTKKYLKEEE